MTKIAEHTFSRTKVSAYSVAVGLLIGLYNSVFPPIDFSFTSVFWAWVVAGIVWTVLLHEAVHGAVALLCGRKPIFGIEPPLVYVTFNKKIPRGQFITIAIAPLIILDTAFGILYVLGVLKVLSYVCLMVNTMGSVGDLWIVYKLLPHESGTLVQDAKTGIEVWERGSVSDGRLGLTPVK